MLVVVSIVYIVSACPSVITTSFRLNIAGFEHSGAKQCDAVLTKCLFDCFYLKFCTIVNYVVWFLNWLFLLKILYDCKLCRLVFECTTVYDLTCIRGRLVHAVFPDLSKTNLAPPTHTHFKKNKIKIFQFLFIHFSHTL